MTTRIAVAGAGAFGKHHLRVIRDSPRAMLVAVVDADRERAGEAAREFGCEAFHDWREIAGRADAAVIATPTASHEEIGLGLLEAGLDVLVEKPLAAGSRAARALCEAAAARGRILQCGHLERFNPAVEALAKIVRTPLFFEIHRLSAFTPRSLDVDVVMDLMIHDIDIVLALTGRRPEEIRAAGLSVLTDKIDIANVRLAFPGGCIANFTASRVSLERVRKLRLFQPRQYLSIDYGRQDGVVCSVGDDHKVVFAPLAVERDEPLRLQWESFLDCIASRAAPRVDGEAALEAIEVAEDILDKIEEHARVVAAALSG
jgi:predicted dehydrogenase